ncbi:unnamed protein product [Camellia sinensis]
MSLDSEVLSFSILKLHRHHHLHRRERALSSTRSSEAEEDLAALEKNYEEVRTRSAKREDDDGDEY